MANMQRHTYALADIADAFQKLNDDATTDEIADVATQAMEDLSEIIASLEMTDRTSVRLIDRWKKTMASLRSATNDNGSRVA